MGLSTRYGLVGIAALALLAAVHQLRGMELSPQPSRDYLLGVLPNFAAAIAISFVLLGIWGDQNPNADFASAKRPFILCASISGLGLIGWELFQITSSSLVFDLHDVGATIVGIGVAIILFYVLKPRVTQEP